MMLALFNDRRLTPWLIAFAMGGQVVRLSRAEVPVVVDKKPVAVIITADKPGPVVEYAAKELAGHLEKATGAKLEVVTESAVPTGSMHRIYVGDCKTARDAGIEASKLPPETFVLRTRGDALFIVGDDKVGDPLEADTRAGTLWGVYEWLERELHVRWLWPGELGTFVPKTDKVVAKDVDETVAPRFFQRRLRPGLGDEIEHPALGFTPGAFEQFKHEETVFLRRHRMGRSSPMGYGHAFVNWWQQYGKEHPDWFQLRDDGKRGPAKAKSRFSMCVSNPELQDQIVSLWEKRRSTKPGVPNFINAVENDILGLCTCEKCRALDGPAPEDYLKFYSPSSKMVNSRFVSDRYAHFWLGVQEQAAKIDPNATVIGYAYFNYFQAPTTGIRLNEHILIGYCPSGGWFPRSAEEDAWMKRQWTGWHSTGARLFLRTNHLLDGYCMPYIFAHQFAGEFQHAAHEGMVATDLDSLTGQWGTQGPTLYLAARLHTRPEANVDDLLAEYYSAFGVAAPMVRTYFAYWEDYTTSGRERINKAMEDLQASRWRTFAKATHVLFPPECFPPAEGMLAGAAQMVRDDKDATARVEFLRIGLKHAKLCAQVAAEISLANPEAPKAGTSAALIDLMKFRRKTERTGIGNFNHLTWVEDLSWKLSDETKQAPDLYP